MPRDDRMGSTIEINDTLKLTPAEGLPATLRVGELHTFRKAGRRLYHLAPTRVFLVHDVEGRWNYLGHAHILELTIDAVRDETRGSYRITRLYPPALAAEFNRSEAPPGKGLPPA